MKKNIVIIHEFCSYVGGRAQRHRPYIIKANKFATTIFNFHRSNVREAIPRIGDFSRLGAKLVIIFLAIYVLIMPKSALAHKMMMDAVVNDDGTVLLEAFFPDGSPAKNTKIEVFSPDGSLFVENATNADGQFIFTPQKKAGIWKAVATGKMGHKTSAEFEMVAGVSAEAIKEEPIENKAGLEGKRIAHKEPIPWNQIISGLGFIFGISAFVISLKLKSDLKRLKNALTSTRD